MIELSVDTKIEREFDRKSQIFKDDIKSLKDYMDKVFATKEDLAKQKAEIIKWMFIFWISQLASFIAIIKFLLPKN